MANLLRLAHARMQHNNSEEREREREWQHLTHLEEHAAILEEADLDSSRMGSWDNYARSSASA
eukprot:5928539-Amphidinium_carterae.1